MVETSDAGDPIGAEAPKMLVVQSLRSQSNVELVEWLASQCATGIGTLPLAEIAGARTRTILAGEDVVIGYEPRRGRTRVLWPWDTMTEVREAAFMRAAWRTYFAAPDQPELRAGLLRWSSRR